MKLDFPAWSDAVWTQMLIMISRADIPDSGYIPPDVLDYNIFQDLPIPTAAGLILLNQAVNNRLNIIERKIYPPN